MGARLTVITEKLMSTHIVVERSGCGSRPLLDIFGGSSVPVLIYTVQQTKNAIVPASEKARDYLGLIGPVGVAESKERKGLEHNLQSL